MRWTETLIPTLRQDPQDAEIASHRLLVRGGFIRKLTSGTYSYLPMGFRVLSKTQNIIREEMVKGGAEEVLLPALQPMDLWQRTGRDKDLAEVMIKFRDRHGKITCLGPTHEEVITSLVAANISSYKELPRILFQIQTKFRDEMRPRFGVMRSCEFIMKDAYSFDVDEKALEKSYKKMYEAYCRIFERCELPYVAVFADPGVMGGGESHEFMVPASDGEDRIARCASCGYAANTDCCQLPDPGGKREPQGDFKDMIRNLGNLSSSAVTNVGSLSDFRDELRKEKKWKHADEIRARLDELGITLEDTPRGTVWKHKK